MKSKKRTDDGRRLLKIGEVAKMNQISVEALRYYDKMGLFPADFVDENGYRYYLPESLVNLDLILWLRMDGAGIAQIREVLERKSLEQLQELFANRAEKIERQLEKLEQQLEMCRVYTGHLRLIREYPESEGYFLSFQKRWYMKADVSVGLLEKDGYELGLKTIFNLYTDKFYYFNSFFGGIFPAEKGREAFQQLIYPTVFHFGDPHQKEALEMEGGIYAILPVYGYYDQVYEKIPQLMEFIHENHYHPFSDCYVFKIWENNECHGKNKEVMELQIRVKKD